jgi:WD40 repeat protein
VTQLDARSPYRGLTPYQEEDRPFFFGRTVDAKVVIANLLASRLTLIYGASGVGKSSLLNAGVVPQLRKAGEQSRQQVGKPESAIVVFRDWTHAPVRALSSAVREACAQASGVPVDGTEQGGLVQTLRDGATLVGGDVLIVLDQFEEHFLYNQLSDDSEAFDEAFVSALNDRDLRANFLISIREDGVAKLDQFKGRIPRLFDNYLRIHHLNSAAAKEAIEGPVQEYNSRHPGQPPVAIQDGLVAAVLADVRTGRVTINDDAIGKVAGAATADDGVETPFLQIVMTRLWEAEVGRGSNQLRLSTFVDTLGGARNIVQSHVREALKALTPDESKLAVAAFRYLITPSRTKIALRAADLAAIAELPAQPVTDLLEKLTGSGFRLLKPIPPPPDRPGAVSYEIWHDVLAQAILDWRAEQVRLADVDAARVRSEADLKAAEARAAELGAAARRDRRRTVIVSICLFLSLVAGAFGWRQTRLAQNEARNNAWRQLVVEARFAMTSDPELSVLLARQALRETLAAGSPIAVEAGDALSQALGASRVRKTFATGSARTPQEARLAAGKPGTLAVLGAGDQTIWIDLSTGKPRNVPAPAAKVADFAVSHDGSRVALALGDKTVQISEATGGGQPRSIALGSSPAAIGWSPDGRLATSTIDGRLTIRTAAGAVAREMPPLDDSQYYEAFDFSADSQRLAGAGTDQIVRIWTTADAKLRGQICRDKEEVKVVRFSPDGKRLATAGMNNIILVWNLDDLSASSCLSKPWRTFVGHHNTVFDVQFSEDGTTIASASADTTIRLWNVDSGSLLLTLRGHREPVERIVFVDNGDELASASWDGTTRLWDVTGQADVFMSGETALGGGRMVTLSRDGRAAVRDTATGEIYRQAVLPDTSQVALDDQGEQVAQAQAKKIQVWRLHDGSLVDEWSVHGNVEALAVSRAGKLVASGDDAGYLSIRDPATKKIVFESRQNYVIGQVKFSPDGRWLVAGDGNGGVEVWEQGSEQTRKLDGHTRSLASIAWSRDGKWMATGGQDSTSKIWSIPAFTPAHTFQHANMVWEVAFSPDSRQLLTVGAEPEGRRFDVTTGTEILPKLVGHTGWIATCRFSPDGKLIATVSWDHTARVWDATTGLPVATYLHDDQLRDLAFSPDSKALITVTETAVARYIPLEPARLLQIADERATRALTPVECQTYLRRDRCPTEQ